MRYPDYRRYWFGTLVSVTGFQMFQFTQLWIIYQLTDSPLFLGYVGLAQAIPAIVLNLVGGVVADRFNQRTLILCTQLLNALLITTLATVMLLGIVEVWHVLTIAFCSGAVNAFDQPARQAIYPSLIEPPAMMSAVAMNSAIWQGARIVAPALAGAIIAVASPAVTFYLSAAGFVVMAVVMFSIKVTRTAERPKTSASGDLVQGLKYIWNNSIFTFLIGMTFFNSFFGMSYMTMMPVFAVDILKVGASGQGQLLSISGVGALLITLWMSARENSGKESLRIIGGATLFGLSVAAFALTSHYLGSFVLALTFMFLIGVFSSLYMITIMTSLQIMVPHNMRGRVMGFYSMTWSILPLGGMQAGAIANAIGAHWALVIGGVVVVLFALGSGALNSRIRNLSDIIRNRQLP